jgi:hypothetical protein
LRIGRVEVRGFVMFKKEASPPLATDYGEGDEVTIELMDDHSPDELVRMFQKVNAPLPEKLAPRFYSGKVPVALRAALHSIARVQPKTRKRML